MKPVRELVSVHANPHANVALFTRHKELLPGVDLLPLPAVQRAMLRFFLNQSDCGGVAWHQIEKIRSVLPRSGHRNYAIPTLRKAARRLRTIDLLTWDRIAPQHRFPRPGEAAKPPENYTGKRTSQGGRVFRLRLDDLREAIEAQRDPQKRAAWRLRANEKIAGTGDAGWMAREMPDGSKRIYPDGSLGIHPDRSLGIHPLNLLVLPSEEPKLNPGAADPAPASAAPTKVDPPTAPRESRGAPTGRERAAGETPSRPVAPSSSASILEQPRAIPEERLQGSVEQPASQLVAPADVSRFMVRMFGKRSRAP